MDEGVVQENTLVQKWKFSEGEKGQWAKRIIEMICKWTVQHEDGSSNNIQNEDCDERKYICKYEAISNTT